MTEIPMPPSVRLDRPWLALDLGQPMQVLSWAINNPGFVTTDRIVWREVRNADLPQELDVHAWFQGELSRCGEENSVAFLTSRNLERFQTSKAIVDGISAFVVATVGLSNAERVGSRRLKPPNSHGTINVAAVVNAELSPTGLLEAQSSVVQARTAAVVDTGVTVPTGRATGTGTDCVAVASPVGETNYAGLHTVIGEALGRAVYRAVQAGVAAWKCEQDVTTAN
ncbi:MAG: adenosylcobinamide amidohydrolase [Pseudomonadota bacterium]